MFSNTGQQKNVTETAYLYANGTVLWVTQYELIVNCIFNFAEIPSDSHYCNFYPYQDDLYDTLGDLYHLSLFPSEQQLSYRTYQVSMVYEGRFDIMQSADLSGRLPGMGYTLYLNRQPLFLFKVFIIPSLLFVILAYSSFYVNKESAPARVTLSITNILN